MSKELFIDDAEFVTSKTLEFLQNLLEKQFEKKLNDAQETFIFDAILRQLTEFCNGEYKNYN